MALPLLRVMFCDDFQGAIESVSIGEIKLSLRKSLVKLGFSVISRDPKLQLLICDLEVVIRPSEKNLKTTRTQRPRSAGRGKWMVVANMARFLSVSVTELVVKVSNWYPVKFHHIIESFIYNMVHKWNECIIFVKFIHYSQLVCTLF